jgi:hypothetical protein
MCQTRTTHTNTGMSIPVSSTRVPVPTCSLILPAAKVQHAEGIGMTD